jgi:hypothetical protein
MSVATSNPDLGHTVYILFAVRYHAHALLPVRLLISLLEVVVTSYTTGNQQRQGTAVSPLLKISSCRRLPLASQVDLIQINLVICLLMSAVTILVTALVMPHITTRAIVMLYVTAHITKRVPAEVTVQVTLP